MKLLGFRIWLKIKVLHFQLETLWVAYSRQRSHSLNSTSRRRRRRLLLLLLLLRLRLIHLFWLRSSVTLRPVKCIEWVWLPSVKISLSTPTRYSSSSLVSLHRVYPIMIFILKSFCSDLRNESNGVFVLGWCFFYRQFSTF